MAVSGKKLASCDSEKNNILSLLHSSKEKLRRERIKNCCEQLRALLPHGEGRKDDVASVLEATVDYMSYLQDRLPRDVTSQITKILQNNRRFSKGNRFSTSTKEVPKDSAPLLLSPVSRNNAASVEVLYLSGDKTGLSTQKTKGSLCSTAADGYPIERISTCQRYETMQPNCYIPVLCLPAMTSLLRLPSLFYNENAVQESTTLLVNPNNVSRSASWIQSQNGSAFHNIDCKECSQSLPVTQHLLFPRLCMSTCGTKSATEFPDI